MNKPIFFDENDIRYKIQKQILVRDKLVDVPAKYKGKGFTVLFPVSTEKLLKNFNTNRIKPAEIIFGKSLLCITLFDFSWSPVGPYTEMVLSVPIFYRTKFNPPLLPILFNNFLRNFGFYVLYVCQSTKIAIEHGTLLTGYTRYLNLVNVNFREESDIIIIEADGDGKEILKISFNKPRAEKIKNQSYMTYFTKDGELIKIRMDIYGIEGRTKVNNFELGQHELSSYIKNLSISNLSIEPKYYRNVVEINPVTREII